MGHVYSIINYQKQKPNLLVPIYSGTIIFIPQKLIVSVSLKKGNRFETLLEHYLEEKMFERVHTN